MGVVSPGSTSAKGNGTQNVAAYIRIDGDDGPVEVSLCNSFSSAQGAAKNEVLELKGAGLHSYNDVLLAASTVWEGALGAISVSGASDDDLTVLYAAMYHAMLHPRSFGDA